MQNMEFIRRVSCGLIEENAYLVCPEGREDAFWIDPGDDLAALEEAMSDSHRTISAILLTHGHFDHILAAQPIAKATGAPVYIHPMDGEMLADPDKSSWSPEMCQLTPPSGLAWLPLPEELELCGETVRVLHTPGHSAGSVCFYLPERKLMFSGDTLFHAGYGRTDLYGGDSRALVQSLRNLFELPEDVTVLPGHGPAASIGQEKRRYRL